jgi:hypothetical protein
MKTDMVSSDSPIMRVDEDYVPRISRSKIKDLA